jgi:hypothetical protein
VSVCARAHQGQGSRSKRVVAFGQWVTLVAPVPKYLLDTALDLPEKSDVFELHTKQIEDKTFRPARHRTRFLHLLVASTSSSQLMEPKADASDVLEVFQWMTALYQMRLESFVVPKINGGR